MVDRIRCTADFEIPTLAASSRIVRLVRRAAQTIKMRRASEHDHGRPHRRSGGKRWIIAASRGRVMAASTSMREVVIVDVIEEV
jgi:hypothetical protein